MSILPIAERELRVAARQPGTYWTRIAGASAALVIGLAYVGLFRTASVAGGPANLGAVLFGMLTWIGLVVALFAGVFLTADCLSEEKREGTLGLLFLTDLRGLDVVVGKLVATSLKGIYGLLAIIPIVAVTLLMGSVTGAQLGRVSLALLNTLLLSLAAGMLVSACSRQSQKALAGTILLVAILGGGGPLADWLLMDWLEGKDLYLRLTSPIYLLVMAQGQAEPLFWPGLVVNVAGTAGLLVGACAVVPRAWQDPSVRQPAHRGAPTNHAAKAGRQGTPPGPGERHPVQWLATRDRWQPLLLWVLAFLALGSVLYLWMNPLFRQLGFVLPNVGGLILLVIYIGLTSQACRFFLETRTSGWLELLLVTPLRGKEVVGGAWRAMLRQFGPPLFLLVMAYSLTVLMAQHALWRMATSAPQAARQTSSTVATNSSGISSNAAITATQPPQPASTSSSFSKRNWISLFMMGANGLTVLANMAALVWFGLWMGLTSSKPSGAILRTLLLVQVIPWLVVSFAANMIVGLILFTLLRGSIGSGTMSTVFWHQVILGSLTMSLYLAKDWFFIAWARKRLYGEFRTVVTEGRPRRKRKLSRSQPPPLPA